MTTRGLAEVTKKSNDYLVIWQPLSPVHTIEQMRVIDAFASTATLAKVRADVEAAAAKGEYSWQKGEGIITVVQKPSSTYRNSSITLRAI